MLAGNAGRHIFCAVPGENHNEFLLVTQRVSSAVIKLLHALAKSTQTAEGHDSTVYGNSRASPRSFFPHHLAAISSAIVLADALAVRNRAASLAYSLTHGII